MSYVPEIPYKSLVDFIQEFKEKYAYWDENNDIRSQMDKKIGEAVCGGGECGAGGCSTSCSGSGCGWG